MKRMLFFCFVLLLIVGFMRVMNWFPHLLTRSTVRQYTSVERAQRMLGLGRVDLPTYFPETIQWPPGEVLGTAQGGKALLLHFTHRDTGDVVLAIEQRQPSAQRLPSRIDPVHISEGTDITLKGIPARLELGVCADKRACNRIRWEEKGESVMLIYRGSVRDLTKIAESMTEG